MSGGCSGTGADSPAEGSSAEWRSIYDRVVALLPPVEELAADHARLKAVNKTQGELLEARENTLEARLLQAEASRNRWKKAYIELSPGANPKLAELQENDLVDSKACDALFDVENFQLKTQQKEARDHVERSESCADHEDIPSNLRAELRKLKQRYETLSSKKDKEVSALLAVKEFLWNQLRTIDKQNTTLEVAQKLQQNIEELQVVARKMDDQVGSLRAEVDAKNKQTSQKRRKDTSKMGRQSNRHKSGEQLPGHCTMQLDSKKDEFDYNRVELNIQRDYQGTEMRVSIHTGVGKPIIIEVKSSDTINSVRPKIFDETAIPPGAQILILSGKELLDIHTFAEYSIHSNSKIHLVTCGSERAYICVNTLNGITIAKFMVMPSKTIDNLKEKIDDEVGIPPEQQCLAFNGRLLENGQTLADYNIGKRTRIDLQLRLHAVG
uniref:Uncharacterized protein n=1 Tax=Avena sativa TaxID=4498 RepID=A0ACD5TTJ1_AVESA